MATKTQPIPEGYNKLTPYITVRGAETAIEFYKNAFDAKEVGRITIADGTIGHYGSIRSQMDDHDTYRGCYFC